jgi:hypothetical protein
VAWPLIIDQTAIALPHWPRDQRWWDQFVPLWSTAVVRADGTVAIDVNDRQADGTRIELDPATRRRRRKALFGWLTSTLPEAFPQICGPVTRDDRGRVTPVTWTTTGKIENNGTATPAPTCLPDASGPSQAPVTVPPTA